MKKLIILFLTTLILILSCAKEEKIIPFYIGHWICETNNSKMEIIIYDTNNIKLVKTSWDSIVINERIVNPLVNDTIIYFNYVMSYQTAETIINYRLKFFGKYDKHQNLFIGVCNNWFKPYVNDCTFVMTKLKNK